MAVVRTHGRTIARRREGGEQMMLHKYRTVRVLIADLRVNGLRPE